MNFPDLNHSRVVAYFADALRAYSPLAATAATTQRRISHAFNYYNAISPLVKFSHFTANQVIFEALDGEDNVHIMQGLQWSGLFHILASQSDIKPRSLRLTDPRTFPQDHRNPNLWPSKNQHQRPPPPYDHRPPSLIGDNSPPVAAPPPGPVDLLALAREGKLKEVVDLLRQGICPDHPTFYDLVATCYDPKHLEELKKIYESFFRSPFRADLQINNKLLEMFSKCGSMVDARRVFDRMPDRTMQSWHLMIDQYAANSMGDDGL